MDIGLVFLGCHRRGGVERSVWELARHLRDRHEVTVYARDFDSSGLEGVRWVSVEAVDGPRRVPSFARACRGALAGAKHEHVISFGVGNVGANVLWVNSVHRAWLDRSREIESGLRASRLRRLMPHHRVLLAEERRYFRRANPVKVVVVADQVGRDLTRLYDLDCSLLTTVHNGFDPQEFSPQLRQARRSEARASFGFAETDVVLLMAANELARKGFGVLLEALRIAAEPDLRVLLVGRADPRPYASETYRAALRSHVRYAGIQSDMGFAHAAADAFVLPTKYEAFCLAIVEALASGLPVLTTDVPGAGDLVEDDGNGLLQRDPNNAEELATLLRRAADARSRERWSRVAPTSVAGLTWAEVSTRAEDILGCLAPRAVTGV